MKIMMGHCPVGVKKKFTACIVCPSELACNVTGDPKVEDIENKINEGETVNY